MPIASGCALKYEIYRNRKINTKKESAQSSKKEDRGMSVRIGIAFCVREVRSNVTAKQGLRGCGSQVCGQGIPDSSGAEKK